MTEQIFEPTEQNRVRRVARQGHYDRETVFRIFDQSWLCHVGFAGPTVIPMFFARIDDDIIFHGSTKSRLMMQLASSEPVCLSVAILDGLVLARSLFHHSMNYRSVVAFGRGREITSELERLAGLKAISDKLMLGRWDDARQPSQREMKATMVAAVKIDSASAKIRTGGPLDDEEDYQLDVWAGVIPLRQLFDEPVADGAADIRMPDYIRQFVARSADCKDQE